MFSLKHVEQYELIEVITLVGEKHTFPLFVRMWEVVLGLEP